jgi:hypothetical protein
MIFRQRMDPMPNMNGTNMAQVALQQNLMKKSRYRIDLSQMIEKKPMPACLNL